ncbi:uncharacterized protein Ir7a [Drosophila pseudoobscura]|uniref:Uncharacterized protein Ir7a n=1 Tax=Drosophila pseudoobscura pseudoobscura TaxID=46245 RepID=A0A6I8UGT3_DROPS|nr:uncharacterized protein LOC4814505 [Drosophila pseudoobscura]
MSSHLWLLVGLPVVALAALRPVKLYQMTPLSAAAVDILEKQVSSTQSTLGVIELIAEDHGHGHVHRDHRQQELLTSILLRTGTSMALRLYQETPSKLPASYVLILVNSAEAFRSLRVHFTKAPQRQEYNFLIVLTRRLGRKAERLEAMRDIFLTSVKRFHTMNAIILTQRNDGVVFTYGFRLYSRDCKLTLSLDLLNRFENGSFRHTTGRIFDRVLGSLGGCPVSVSWYPLPPFVHFLGDMDDPEERKEVWRLTGIDGEIIKVLSKIFNFSIKLMPPCKKQRTCNGSCSSCFDQLNNGTSSVLIGAMSGSHANRSQFTTTVAYHQSSLVFVVNIKSQIGAVAQLLVPFSSTVWLALVVSCSLVVFVFWLKRRRRNGADIAVQSLLVLTTLLGNPLETFQLPTTSRQRMLYSIWLFLVLVLRVVYQGKLYDSFRSPYNPPLPSKISQLIAENYTLISQEYYDYYPHNLTVLFTESTQDRFDRIQRDGEDERLTTTALIANIGYNNRINWQTSHLTHVREHIFLYQLVMYLHVHSLLKFGFDRKLKQLQSSGIIGYIVHDFDRPQYRVPPTEPHEISPLPLGVFCGLYFIATILLTAAVLAFLLELLSVRVAWLRRYLV